MFIENVNVTTYYITAETHLAEGLALCNDGVRSIKSRLLTLQVSRTDEPLILFFKNIDKEQGGHGGAAV
jgi:hypothetical protein